MTYGSLGKGQFLIWNVGYLGLGPIQVSLAHMLSVPVSPFSNSKKKAAPFLAPPSSFSVFDSCQALPRTLHPFTGWGSATCVEGERLGPCQEDVKRPRVGEQGRATEFSGSIFLFPAAPSGVPTFSPSIQPAIPTWGRPAPDPQVALVDKERLLKGP